MSLASILRNAAAITLAALSGAVATAQSNLSSSKASAVQIEELLAELDERFERGDIEGYLSRFEPDHPGTVAILGRHLDRLVSLSKRRTRDSRILAGPSQVGGRTLVRVRHELALTIGGGAPRKLTEDTYLAVRVDDGELIPTFAVEMPPAMKCVQANKFKCPPCNYEIGGVDGFLCVPLPPAKSLALESASFYLIGTDVVCDVHVQVANKPQKANVAARKLAEAFAKIEPTADVGLATNWVPPMHAKNPPAGMDSARVVVKLPFDNPKSDGERTIFHVVTFGGLQHVLLVRGTTQSLARHQGELDKLFKSYMLLEVDCDLAVAAARPLRHHIGGSFDGSRYDNTRYGVTFTGPEGWRPQHRIGGARFRARWTGPNGSQLWLVGYGVPTGMESWSQATADRWIRHHCKKHGLAMADAQPKTLTTDWHKGPNGGLERSCVLTCKDPTSPTTPRRRVLHVQLHDDLLLIVDGYGGGAKAEQAVLSTLGSLARKR